MLTPIDWRWRRCIEMQAIKYVLKWALTHESICSERATSPVCVNFSVVYCRWPINIIYSEWRCFGRDFAMPFILIVNLNLIILCQFALPRNRTDRPFVIQRTKSKYELAVKLPVRKTENRQKFPRADWHNRIGINANRVIIYEMRKEIR